MSWLWIYLLDHRRPADATCFEGQFFKRITALDGLNQLKCWTVSVASTCLVSETLRPDLKSGENSDMRGRYYDTTAKSFHRSITCPNSAASSFACFYWEPPLSSSIRGKLKFWTGATRQTNEIRSFLIRRMIRRHAEGCTLCKPGTQVRFTTATAKNANETRHGSAGRTAPAKISIVRFGISLSGDVIETTSSSESAMAAVAAIKPHRLPA